jgi:protease-4
VVLRIDSPGGYAQLVEQIYLDVLELRKEKPVVASVVTALSGGYYVAVGAEYIRPSTASLGRLERDGAIASRSPSLS